VNLVSSGTLVVRVALAALVLLVGGCAWDGPMSTVVPGSDFARAILSLYALITWITALIGLLVFVVLLWILVRFRARPEAPLPRQIRGHTLLEIAWTIVPALVLLVIAVPTIQGADSPCCGTTQRGSPLAKSGRPCGINPKRIASSLTNFR